MGIGGSQSHAIETMASPNIDGAGTLSTPPILEIKASPPLLTTEDCDASMLIGNDITVCDCRHGPQAARTKSAGANNDLVRGLFAHAGDSLPLYSPCLSRPSQLTNISTVSESLSSRQTSVRIVVESLSIFACTSSLRHGSQQDATHGSCRLFDTTLHASAPVCTHIALALAGVEDCVPLRSSFLTVPSSADKQTSCAIYNRTAFPVKRLAHFVI